MAESTLLVVSALVLATSACSGSPLASIDYRGERIKLSHEYHDYDDYKNDPANLHPSEVARVQRLVRSAPVAKSFGSWEAAAGGASGVVFPGYGSGTLKSDWHSLRAFLIEVPQANEDRVLVFRKGAGDQWTLVDDFLLPDGPVREVVEEGGGLVFSDQHGKRILVRPLATS